MKIEEAKTVQDYEKILKTISSMMTNPYCDRTMFLSLMKQRRKALNKIKELK